MALFLRPRWSTFRLLEPWRSRVLWVSLAANLFAIPLIAGPHLMHHRGPPGPPGFDMLIERLSRDLPPPDRTRFRDRMALERPWYEMTRSRLDEARAEVARQVKHEPFDPTALHGALATMRDRMGESAGRFDESLIAAIGSLSQDGRNALGTSMPPGPR